MSNLIGFEYIMDELQRPFKQSKELPRYENDVKTDEASKSFGIIASAFSFLLRRGRPRSSAATASVDSCVCDDMNIAIEVSDYDGEFADGNQDVTAFITARTDKKTKVSAADGSATRAGAQQDAQWWQEWMWSDR